MCTLTWLRRADGFEVFFNRDELKTREVERPPEIYERDGVRFLAPRDSKDDGSWIGVNDRGLAVALLNRYVPNAGPPREAFRSRGLLVMDLLTALHRAEVGERLAETDLQRYKPFSLFAADPAGRARLFEWTGWHVEETDDPDAMMPLASSSFDQTLARVHRRGVYADLIKEYGTPPDEEALLAFHRSHAGGPGPFSVCMHRPDADTRSFTRVRVGVGGVTLQWQPGTPCSGAQAQVLELPRRDPVPTCS
ncbi:MAG: NRDE family protein [Planctomycetota bacterium]|nr:NRDE family protein [Planctomycetota bacterium]